MEGPGVKKIPLLATPLTVTTTSPATAPIGTTARMLVLLHDVIVVTAMPLKATVPVPCVVPKFDPVMVITPPTGPVDELRLVTIAGTTKFAPMLANPATATTTVPEVAPAGTGTTMLEADQDVGVAKVSLKVTVLVPCMAPKFDPAIVMEAPTAPEAGVREVMVGKEIKLLAASAPPDVPHPRSPNSAVDDSSRRHSSAPTVARWFFERLGR
jgi:hypothetical protein